QALLAMDRAWGLWNHNISNVFCDEWGDIVTCNRQGMVTSLYVYSENANAVLESRVVPAAITALSALQKLDLSGVAVSGSLPCSISRLTALQTLNVGMPQFHVDIYIPYLLGDDPTDILSIQSSMIPPVIALMSLNLTTGKLPSSLSALTSLRTLDLRFLSMTHLPQWISSLSRLSQLDVTGNFDVHRSAPFPTEWMALSGLRTLRAGLNGFTGTIPSTISALTNLTELELYFNNLSGSIPAGINNNLTSLIYLGLSFNNLTGVVPATSAFLQTLDLSHNHLTRVLTNINAYVIKLSHNDIRRLPPIEGSVLIIRELDLSYNPLSKGLDDLFWMNRPDELVLNLGSCNFSGPFPFTPIEFKLLDVSNNHFTRPIPDCLLYSEASNSVSY
ncbi:unnamed protein product, partial [Closterium sp. Naga37s-1]